MNNSNHQPFLFQKDNSYFIAYCTADSTYEHYYGVSRVEGKKWQLRIKRLEDDYANSINVLGDNFFLVCNPNLFSLNDKLFLSFIACKDKPENNSPVAYSLYEVELDTETFLPKSEPTMLKTHTFSGFSTLSYIYYISSDYLHNPVIVRKNKITGIEDTISNMPSSITLKGAQFRLISIFNSESEILISTKSQTVKINLLGNNSYLNHEYITGSDGSNAYKCTILNNKKAYTKMLSEGFESREIVVEDL